MIVSSPRGLAAAFQVPKWGQVASETPPEWLVQLIQAQRVSINSLGGLTYHHGNATCGCLPEDYILLTEDGHIEFCTASEFVYTYTLLDERHAA